MEILLISWLIIMKSDDDIFKIYSELINIAENLDPDDVFKEESNTPKGYKFKSRTRKGEHRHKFFLYILPPNKQNRVEVRLDTGKHNNVIDKKRITTRFPYDWHHIKKKIVVSPEDINSGRKTYDDIKDLMNQSYRTLNLIK